MEHIKFHKLIFIIKLKMISSTSATQPQPQRPNIIPPDDEDLIDSRLLLDLAEMEGTIHRNP
jgi:hypothetical protein